jgi:hypothetical protein
LFVRLPVTAILGNSEGLRAEKKAGAAIRPGLLLFFSTTYEREN